MAGYGHSHQDDPPDHRQEGHLLRQPDAPMVPIFGAA